MKSRSLPLEIYLLAIDPARDKLTNRSWIGYLVQGGAVTELLLGGYLVTGDGKVAPRGGGSPDDPVLSQVLADIEAAGRRSWRYLLRHGGTALAATRDQLASEGVITQAGRRVTAADRDGVAALQRRAGELLAGGADPAGEREAALIALASVVPLTTIATRREWRARSGRVAALAAQVSAGAPAFSELIGQMRRTRRLAYSAGGPAH
jgi:hypothetical protein